MAKLGIWAGEEETMRIALTLQPWSIAAGSRLAEIMRPAPGSWGLPDGARAPGRSLGFDWELRYNDKVNNATPLLGEAAMRIALPCTAMIAGAVLVIPAQAENALGSAPNVTWSKTETGVSDLLLALGLSDLGKATRHMQSRPILPIYTVCKVDSPTPCCCRANNTVHCDQEALCIAIGGECVEKLPPYPINVNCE